MTDEVTVPPGAVDSAATALVRRAAEPVGAVLLVHSWWGLTEHFRLLAGELAAAGLSTVAVDLYDGATTDDPAEARRLRVRLDDEAVLRRAHTGLLAARELVGGAPAGVLGFSMGAEFGIRLAARHPANVGALVAFYGVCLPDGLARLTAPVQVHLATRDEFATPEEVGGFVSGMLAAGCRFELHSYPGTGHAFTNRSRPEAYRPEAAALARTRLLGFFAQHLTRRA